MNRISMTFASICPDGAFGIPRPSHNRHVSNQRCVMKRFVWIAVFAFAGIGMAQEEPGIFVSIQGQWTGKAKNGTEVTYTFTKDGCVTWNVAEEDFKKAFPNGLKAKYAIRIAKPYAELDIFDFDAEQFKKVRFWESWRFWTPGVSRWKVCQTIMGNVRRHLQKKRLFFVPSRMHPSEMHLETQACLIPPKWRRPFSGVGV